MKKKDDNSIEYFEKIITDMKDKFTPQELECLQELIKGEKGGALSESLELYYHYQQPDYAQEAKPIALFLMKLWKMENEEDYPFEEMQEELSSVPVPILEKELRNFLLNLFIKFPELPANEDSREIQLWYVYWLMEHHRMESCLDIILELLKQSPRFISVYCNMMYEMALPIIIYQLGQNQLPLLLEFMKEKDIVFLSKEYVCDAVAEIAISQPERRTEVAEWFCQLLDYLYEHMPEMEEAPLLIDYIALTIKKIHAVETTLPILEKLYQKQPISQILVGGIKKWKKELKKERTEEEDYILEFQSIDEMVNTLLEEVFIGDEDEWDDEEEDEDEDDTSFYINGITPKKLKLKIALKESEPEIWRMVEVPSNVRLERFANVVNRAMGWEGYHLSHFFKGKTVYSCEEDFWGGSRITEIDSYSISLGEILTRKGMWIDYEYDFGDSWQHRITLEAQEAYKKDEMPTVFLIDGANACPPEDCGGIYIYRDMVEALQQPRSKAAKEYRKWLGKSFNPLKFNLKEAQKAMEGFPIQLR